MKVINGSGITLAAAITALVILMTGKIVNAQTPICKDGARVTITGTLTEPHLGDKKTLNTLYSTSSAKPCEVDAIDAPSELWPEECRAGRRFIATGMVTTKHEWALNPLIATSIRFQ